MRGQLLGSPSMAHVAANPTLRSLGLANAAQHHLHNPLRGLYMWG